MTRQERNQKIIKAENKKFHQQELAFYNQLISDCRSKTKPISNGKYEILTHLNAPDDCKDLSFITTLNSVLRHIRRGGIDYIFREKQLRCILMFEPDALAWHIPDSDCIAVALPETPENLERFISLREEGAECL